MRKMLILVMVLLSFLFFGCSSNKAHSSVEQANGEELIENDFTEDDEDEAPIGTSGIQSMSQDEAEIEGGVYVLRNGEFYPIDNCELKYGAYTIGSVDRIGVTRDDDSSLITLTKDDQLVTFLPDSSFKVNSANDEGYILPIEVSNVTKSGLEFSGIGPLLDCEYHSYTEEIEGYTFNNMEELESVLSEHGARIFRDIGPYDYSDEYIGADHPMTITGGYYHGTSYLEYDIVIDAKCYSLVDEYELPVNRTKNGYFIVDYSSLESGRYVFNVGSNYPNKYLVDIVR